MTDMNRASLVGRLGADPEVRSLPNGDKVVSLRLATGEKWKDKATGEKKEKTEWHSVVIFGPLGGVAEKYLKKGSRVLIEGSIRTRKWQDTSGADRYSTEVVLSGFGANLILLDGQPGQGGGSGGGAAQGQDDAYGSIAGSQGGRVIDDEIPF